MVSCGLWNGGAEMDQLYIGSPNDAEVDALLSQLSDESILKLKVHHAQQKTTSYGFEYPTFTDGWLEDNEDDDLDNQLASRFSSLKLPVHSAKKRGKDSSPMPKRGYNWDRTVGKRGKDYAAIGGKKGGGRRGRNLEAVGEEEDDNGNGNGNESEEENDPEKEVEHRAAENSVKPSTRIVNRSRAWHQPPKEKTSTSLPLATELQSCKSLPRRADGAIVDNEDDLDDVEAQLQTRFRALKAPSAPAPPPTRNVGLENLMQFAEQQRSSTSSTIDWENYGSVFSAPSSPSTKLLGRSTPRSSPSPRVLLTSSVSSSCRCSAPSPLKLLKQVSSKTFPSKQQLPAGPPTTPPTVGSSDVATAAAAIPPLGSDVGKEDHKSKGGSGTSRIGKDGEKLKKEKREKRNTVPKQHGGQ